MSDFQFNISRGNIRKHIDASDTIELLMLKTSDTEATMQDFDDIAALLAGTAVEADFTNYARATLASLSATVDDTENRVDFDCDDVTFSSAGGATNNTTTHAIMYVDVDGTDANALPLLGFDAVFTTTGADVTLAVHADGFAFA